MRLFAFYCSIVLLLVPEYLVGQDRPTQLPSLADIRENIIRAWPSVQLHNMDKLAAVKLTVQTRHYIDTPYGRSRLETVVRVSGQPGNWNRVLLSASVNGQPVTGEELERYRMQWQPFLYPYQKIANQIIPLAMQEVAALHPTSTVSIDTVDGMATWRVNGGSRCDGRIERATLWFRHNSLQLEKSRLVYESTETFTMLATIDYQHIAGLDLPEHIHTKGVLRYQRRLRSFTVLVTTDSSYENVVLVDKDEQTQSER